ncbi:MAG: DinB family protein [Terriglobia bacterium]
MPKIYDTGMADRLRDELVKLLKGGGAHATFEQAVKDFPPPLRGQKPPGASHTPWEVLEHLRIAQGDMLEFSRDAKHESPDWPAGYWPPTPAPPTGDAWQASIAAFRQDAEAMEKLLADPASDLTQPLPWGSGQSLLREALQVADHNAYHIGELVLLRRLLGAWKT